MNPILLLLLATLTAQAATFTGKVVGVSGSPKHLPRSVAAV
jgi:hypothetical protein